MRRTARGRKSPFLCPGFGSGAGLRVNANPCGSWLASDGGGSGNVNVECAGLFAGKPAPTGIWVGGSGFVAVTDNQCRSEPARDGGGSGNINVAGAGLIAGKPAPTGIWVGAGICGVTDNQCRSEPARDGGGSGNWCRLVLRYREQAHSYRDLWLAQALWLDT